MKKDRFKGYDDEVRRLVTHFEEGQQQGSHPYFDPDELEIIIDFYLDAIDEALRKTTLPADTRRLENAVAYAERLFPTAPGIRLRKAHLYSIQGRYDHALKILHELERLEPDNTDVQYALGTVYSALDQHRRSIQYYTQAARDGYQLGTIYGNIGDEYYRMGRPEDALRYYKKSVARNADEERSLHNLEATYDELNQNGEAIDFFNHFVRQNPYSRVGWFCLGRAQMSFADRHNGQREHYLAAIDAFHFVLTIDSRYFDAYVLIAECQQTLHDHAGAVATLRESLDCAADAANVLFSIATIYMEMQNYQTASIYLKQATERDPFFSEAWLKLAECYDYMGYSDDAEMLYQRSLGMNEENDDFWLRYADFLIHRKRYDEAITLMQRGLTNADYPHAFNLRLACCYFYTGQRNMLFNTLIDCTQNGDPINEILDYCPEMVADAEVMNILDSR